MFDVRILSDETASYAEFPWMILILKKTIKDDEDVLERLCGGSLIRANGINTHFWGYNLIFHFISF